jgi:hypothetical protein
MAESNTHVHIPRSVLAPLSGAQAVADVDPGELIDWGHQRGGAPVDCLGGAAEAKMGTHGRLSPSGPLRPSHRLP